MGIMGIKEIRELKEFKELRVDFPKFSNSPKLPSLLLPSLLNLFF